MEQNIGAERVKQSFLAVIKWCSRNTGARVVFDQACMCPNANVDTKVITMPTKVAISRSDSVLGTLIHEAMHIKHTPKWLSDLCRDPVDHTIFNALEDRRIEGLACQQLRALDYFLKCTVDEVRKYTDPDVIPLGFKVLGNIAAGAIGERVFPDKETTGAEALNKTLHRDLLDIYDRVFSVTMGKSFEANVEELYKKVDEFRKVYKLPDVDPSKKEKKLVKGGEGDEYAEGQYGVLDKQSRDRANKLPGTRTHTAVLEDLSHYLIDLNSVARERIKETLKKTMTVIIDEGRELNTDALTELLTGNIDEAFNDVKSERKMRTKLYFLMDVSGSMDSYIAVPGLDGIVSAGNLHGSQMHGKNRQDLSASTFKAIAEVMDECREVWGTDIEYENYIFSTKAKRIDKMQDYKKYGSGGGTSLLPAMTTVFKDIHKDDPANKRILVVLTDGDVGSTEDIKQLINKEAQDIRVVFVGISDDPTCDLIRHNIIHEDHGEAMIVEALEECL